MHGGRDGGHGGDVGVVDRRGALFSVLDENYASATHGALDLNVFDSLRNQRFRVLGEFYLREEL